MSGARQHALFVRSRPVVIAALRTLAILVIWQLGVLVLHPPRVAIPTPSDVLFAFVQTLQIGFNGIPFLDHLGATAQRLVLGFAACLVVGIPSGAVMANISLLRRMLTPFIALFRPVPSFSWLTILIVWFGFGEFTKIAVVYVVIVPIVVLGTMDGVMRVPPLYREAARSLGASRLQMTWRVVLPSALPEILSSARVALAIAWAAVIAAELVGAASGLGVIIIQSARFLRTDQTFMGLVTLAVLGAATDRLMVLLMRRTVAWAQT